MIRDTRLSAMFYTFHSRKDTTLLRGCPKLTQKRRCFVSMHRLAFDQAGSSAGCMAAGKTMEVPGEVSSFAPDADRRDSLLDRQIVALYGF